MIITLFNSLIWIFIIFQFFILINLYSFTAFSQIIVAWAVITTAQITSLASKSNLMINSLIIILNIIIYIVFIVIVLIFELTKPSSAKQCGARFIEETNNDIQYRVSIAYAVIIAFFSLLIGGGFLIYGNKLMNQVKSTSKQLGTVTQGISKTFVITWVSSISFLLHCLFIIIQVSLKEPVVIFNFILIIVTEIFPSAFILSTQFMFNQAATKGAKIINTSSTFNSTTYNDSSTIASSTTGATSSSTGQSTTAADEMEDI